MSNQSAETIAAEPFFDPHNVGASLDRIVEQMPIHATWLQGSVVGDVASRRNGDGFEKNGIRPYEFGDDRRWIDHRATARNTNPGNPLQVRTYPQEITPSLWIVTDMLAERHKQNPGYVSEQILALSAVTALMRIGQMNGMPIGLIASDSYGYWIDQRRAAQGRGHIAKTAQQLADVVLTPTPEVEPDESRMYLSDALYYATQRCTASMIAVVSDFRDVAEPQDPEYGWYDALALTASNHNEILAVELTNPYDQQLPDGVARVSAEDGEVIWVGTGKKGQKVREQYAEDAAKQTEAIADSLKQFGHHIVLSATNPKWLTSLRTQLAVKARR